MTKIEKQIRSMYDYCDFVEMYETNSDGKLVEIDKTKSGDYKIDSINFDSIKHRSEIFFMCANKLAYDKFITPLTGKDYLQRYLIGEVVLVIILR